MSSLGLCKMASSHTDMVSENSNIFRLISWNIDGLDERNIEERTMAACDTIMKLAPDVVFLQEVVPSTNLILKARLSSKYSIYEGNQVSYFTCTLVKNSTECRITKSLVQPFVNSQMGRNLLMVNACYKNMYISLLNTHLESTAPAQAERQAQFQQALGEVQIQDPDRVVIFGGDTNLRDKEITSMGGVPKGIIDLWEACGADPKTKFTWDTTTNDNLDWESGRYKPKIRFDRLYIRPAAGHCTNLSISSFTLIGKDRLPGCGRFPSDHYGIVCDFDILPGEM
ncbi:tyrosyl-DNA phosphodiesterase 2-like isoform X1 [Lytechinus variegatus]|uniref:tyrosyl-DNA phosphodiesterase 2-like isoform X1 n=2 Tax=Lytechinus variegatus TaxID=7654 RepID=UPI001BB151BD|nr:tyrosyl-DNA phosphodiesterase 2-like isoform X1 [Lytechinus variegatus]